MSINFNKTIKISLGLLVILGLILWIQSLKPRSATTDLSGQTTSMEQKIVTDPIARASERITKKPFGIYITPKNSPVQPERFSGFHTGTDFETFPEEASTNVPFSAICDGKIIDKRTATGYGGLLVQSCSFNHQPVTVVYGHVSLTSIVKNKGDNLTAGETIGNLGQPPQETDGERKHLHLGIHKGMKEDIRGYVQKESELTAWMDWQKL